MRVHSVIELLYLNIDQGGRWRYLAKDKNPNYC